jgi:hypothetical protein
VQRHHRHVVKITSRLKCTAPLTRGQPRRPAAVPLALAQVALGVIGSGQQLPKELRENESKECSSKVVMAMAEVAVAVAEVGLVPVLVPLLVPLFRSHPLGSKTHSRSQGHRHRMEESFLRAVGRAPAPALPEFGRAAPLTLTHDRRAAAALAR